MQHETTLYLHIVGPIASTVFSACKMETVSSIASLIFYIWNVRMGKSTSAWCCNAGPIECILLVFVTDPLSELCHLLLIM